MSIITIIIIINKELIWVRKRLSAVGNIWVWSRMSIRVLRIRGRKIRKSNNLINNKNSSEHDVNMISIFLFLIFIHLKLK